MRTKNSSESRGSHSRNLTRDSQGRFTSPSSSSSSSSSHRGGSSSSRGSKTSSSKK